MVVFYTTTMSHRGRKQYFYLQCFKHVYRFSLSRCSEMNFDKSEQKWIRRCNKKCVHWSNQHDTVSLCASIHRFFMHFFSVFSFSYYFVKLCDRSRLFATYRSHQASYDHFLTDLLSDLLSKNQPMLNHFASFQERIQRNRFTFR